ncbi:MAG TPA: hypothetical protein ENJ56_01740, partial [Anaerolineae bacterium]|nr:hypothetical protein [Anaerolineae bacterium]
MATKLYLFGPLRIENERQTHLPTGNTAMLLGYLALHPYPLPRSQIAGTLFPDVPETQARRLLTHTLYRLRRTLDSQHLQSNGETLGLHDVWIDVVAFRTLAAQGKISDALALYKADLLETVDADWILGQRVLLREQFMQLLAQQITQYREAERYGDALQLAQRLVQANPLDESAHVTVMQLYMQLRKYSAALQQYDYLLELLELELAVTPLPATAAVAEQIRQKIVVASAADTRLIGRRAPRAYLLNQLEKLSNNCGSITLLEGAAGIGKTHLLNDISAALRWRNLPVIQAKADDAPQPEPYAPFVAALQQLLQQNPTLIEKLTPLASRLIRTLSADTQSVILPAISSPRALQKAVHQLL